MIADQQVFPIRIQISVTDDAPFHLVQDGIDSVVGINPASGQPIKRLFDVLIPSGFLQNKFDWNQRKDESPEKQCRGEEAENHQKSFEPSYWSGGHLGPGYYQILN